VVDVASGLESETAATKCAHVRSYALIVTIASLLTCTDTCKQGIRGHMLSVVVLDVLSSVRSALTARVCRIRAETKGRSWPPPVSVRVSGPLSAASRVVYKTAAQPTQQHRR